MSFRVLINFFWLNNLFWLNDSLWLCVKQCALLSYINFISSISLRRRLVSSVLSALFKDVDREVLYALINLSIEISQILSDILLLLSISYVMSMNSSSSLEAHFSSKLTESSLFLLYVCSSSKWTSCVICTLSVHELRMQY